MSDNLKPDEFELINAYVDGELAADDRRQFEAQLVDRPQWRATLKELEALRALFKKMPRKELSEEFAEQVLNSAEEQMLLGTEHPPSIEGAVSDAIGTKASRKGIWWMVAAVAAGVLGLLLIPMYGEKTELAQKSKSDRQSQTGEQFEAARPASEALLDATSRQPEISSLRVDSQPHDASVADDAIMPKEEMPGMDRDLGRSQSEYFAREGVAEKSTQTEADVVNPSAAMRSVTSAKAPHENASTPSMQSETASREQGQQGRGYALLAPQEKEAELLIEVQVPVGLIDQLAINESARPARGGGREAGVDARTKDQAPPTRESEVADREEVGQFVAVETSLDRAGEILARLEESGAVLRHHPMADDFSQKLAAEFLTNQTVAAEGKRAEGGLDHNTTDYKSSMAQTQVENIAKGQIDLGLSGDVENEDHSVNVVRLNQAVPEQLQRLATSDQDATPAVSNQNRSQWLNDALQQAKLRTVDQPGAEIESRLNKKIPTLPRDELQTQIRMYLWVREIPAHSAEGISAP